MSDLFILGVSVLLSASAISESLLATFGVVVASIVGFAFEPTGAVQWACILLVLVVLVIFVSVKEICHGLALHAAFKSPLSRGCWMRALHFSRIGWAVHAFAASVLFSYWKYYSKCSELWIANFECVLLSVTEMPVAVWSVYAVMMACTAVSACLLVACEVATRVLVRRIGGEELLAGTVVGAAPEPASKQEAVVPDQDYPAPQQPIPFTVDPGYRS